MLYEGKRITINSSEFKLLFETYFPSLCLFSEKFIHDSTIAKDIAQDAFIKIWNSDKEFENEKAAKAYLYVLVKNASIDFIKEQKGITNVHADNEEIIAEDHFLQEIVREETYRMLDIALANLGEQTKRIVELTLQGNSNKIIADELEISVNTVKTLKLRAYKSLRDQLGNQFVAILMLEFFKFF
ncbi:sigma-70 family RNA polymerase sigma factor [Puteibacter caeruleilacunae]|nr:sigma-70 family RNA polymerase sigma factor [Puteibacter caeruleilacunae]